MWIGGVSTELYLPSELRMAESCTSYSVAQFKLYGGNYYKLVLRVVCVYLVYRINREMLDCMKVAQSGFSAAPFGSTVDRQKVSSTLCDSQQFPSASL